MDRANWKSVGTGTNKLDFTKTVLLAPEIDWVWQARWVEDDKFFTSSGVSAGMDITQAAIAYLYDQKTAQETAEGIEYE